MQSRAAPPYRSALALSLVVHTALLAAVLVAIRPAQRPSEAEMDVTLAVAAPLPPAASPPAVLPPAPALPPPPSPPQATPVPQAEPAILPAIPTPQPDTPSPPPPKPVPKPRPQRPPTIPRPAPRRAAAPVPEQVAAPESPSQSAAPSATPPRPVLSAAPGPDWQQAIAAWLRDHQSYPDAARRAGDEGAVQLRFTLDRAGNVLDVTVLHGSGSAVLDSAALALLQGAHLPPAPNSQTSAGPAAMTVNLHYRLEH